MCSSGGVKLDGGLRGLAESSSMVDEETWLRFRVRLRPRERRKAAIGAFIFLTTIAEYMVIGGAALLVVTVAIERRYTSCALPFLLLFLSLGV